MVILTTDIKSLKYMHETFRDDMDNSLYLRALNCKEEWDIKDLTSLEAKPLTLEKAK